MHLIGHALSALPFVAAGSWWGAAGALAPDLTWALNEWRYRRSSVRPWTAWVSSRPESELLAYRLSHGAPCIIAAAAATWALYPQALAFWFGWVLHVALDLPTHKGRMRQQPLFPLSSWRWPWTII